MEPKICLLLLQQTIVSDVSGIDDLWTTAKEVGGFLFEEIGTRILGNIGL